MINIALSIGRNIFHEYFPANKLLDYLYVTHHYWAIPASYLTSNAKQSEECKYMCIRLANRLFQNN